MVTSVEPTVLDTKAPDCIADIKKHNKEFIELFKKICPQILEWTKELDRWGANLVDGAVITKLKTDDMMFRIKFFTATHEYSFTFRPSYIDSELGYLGGGASSRVPLAGEDWTRGNDLSDGKFCKATWDAIIRDIVAFELVRLGK